MAGFIQRIVHKHLFRPVFPQPRCNRASYRDPPLAPVVNVAQNPPAGTAHLRTEFTKRLEIIEHDGIMQGTLVRLYLTPIHICLRIVPETPAAAHISIRIFQRKEILAAYPTALITIFPTDCIDKQFGHIALNVVDDIPVPPPRNHRRVRHGTAAREKVIQCRPRWKMLHYVRGYP